MNEPRIIFNDPNLVNSKRRRALVNRVEAVVSQEELGLKLPSAKQIIKTSNAIINKITAHKFEEKKHPRDPNGKFAKNATPSKSSSLGTQLESKIGPTDIRGKAVVNGDQGFKDILVGLSLGAINEVMDVPKDLPKFNITQQDLVTKLKKDGTRGVWYLGTSDIDVDSGSGPDISVSLIHEIGHYLDASMGDLRFDGKLLLAFSKSQTITKLKAVSENPKSTKEQKDFVSYLLSPREVFARAFSQYIVSRSSNKELKKEVAARQKAEGTLWNDKDFEPIGKEMDRIFKTKKKK